MSRLVEALIVVATHPRWRSMTIEQFVEALYVANARHILNYGRPIGMTGELEAALSRYINEQLPKWSDSEEAALRDGIARYVEES